MNNKTIFSMNFLILVVGQIISMFANQIVRYILPLSVLLNTGSSQTFASLIALSFIAMLIMLPIGGIIADKFNKKHIMVLLDFCTGLMLIIYLIVGKQDTNIYLIISVMIFLNIIKSIYQPTVQASTIFIVNDQNIQRANSIIDVVSSISNIAGPIVAGILINFIDIKTVVFISAFLFFISALIEMFLKIESSKQMKSDSSIIKQVYSDIRQGFKFIFKDEPTILKFSFYYAIINLLIIPLSIIVLPVLVNTRLGFSSEYANLLYGLANGLIAFGALLGGSIAAFLSDKLNVESIKKIYISFIVILAISGSILSFNLTPFMSYCVIVLASVSALSLSTIFTVTIISYIQIITPTELLGKVLADVMMLCMISSPIGQFMYGKIMESNFSINVIYLGASLLMLLFLLIINSYRSKKILQT